MRPRPFVWRNQILVICALMLSPAIAAAAGAPAAPAENLDRVVIEGNRARDEMPLARFLAGEKIFAEQKNLAPNATLRFMIVPRDSSIGFDQIDLTLIDPDAPQSQRSVDIPLDAAGIFDLPQGHFGRNSLIRANLPPNSLHWRPLVQSAGLTVDTRRLGDLRLECEVKEAGEMNRADLPFFVRLFGGSSISECYSTDEHFFLAPRELAAVTLEDGAHKAAIEAERLAESSQGRVVPRTYYVFEEGWRARAYSPPLGDETWSNETLVHFHFKDELKTPNSPS